MPKFCDSYVTKILVAAMLMSMFAFTSFSGIKAASAGEIVYGDVNGDGKVNSIDFALMRQFLLGIISEFPVSGWQIVADVKADGAINSTDYAVLRMYILGIINKLPYGESTVTPTPTTTSQGTTPSVPTATPTIPPVSEGDLFVAPNGDTNSTGSLNNPTTLESAIARIAPDCTIFMLEGTYNFSKEVFIQRGNDGAEGKLKKIYAYDSSKKPVLDFSDQPYISNDVNERGIKVGGNYWHFKNLEIVGAADNGMYLCGSHNIVEQCVFHNNRDTGLQISRLDSDDVYEKWPSYNLILNCDSYDNDDPDNHEDADGFACKLTSGPGNVFRGCIAHHNNDDGWDFFTKPATGPIGEILVENCIAYSNGYHMDGSSSPGDGNGFKLGGSDMPVNHTIRYCIAFKNRVKGIHYNSNDGSILVENCTSWDNQNGGNFVFTRGTHIFKNNLSFYNLSKSDEPTGTDTESSNCWWKKPDLSTNAKGLVVSADDFISLNPIITRKADGSIELGDFLKLAPGSDLIGAGIGGKNIGAR